MSALILLVALAASPTPRVHPSANSYVFIPRLDRLGGVSAFTQVAGRKSPMFRSAVWSEELMPFIGVDLTSPESLAAAGIDATGPFTVSLLPAGKIACVQLQDGKVFADRGNSAVGMHGMRWPGTLSVKGVTFGAATTQEKSEVVGGFVQKGNAGCVVRSPKGRGASLLEDAAKLLDAPKAPSSWKTGSDLPGVMFAVSDRGAIAINATGSTMTMESRSGKLPLSLPALEGAGPSPYADILAGGVASAKLRVDPASVQSFARGFAGQLASFCPACDERAIGAVSGALAAELTGQVYLRIESLALGGGLKGDAAKYFAIRHAYLAELKNPDAVKAQLLRLEGVRGMRKTPNGVALMTSAGDIDIGVYGKHLCASNDAAARQVALGAVAAAKGGKLSHGAEFSGDPKLVARALKQLSLLDAVGSQDLAALFAASVELGPLLSSSTSFTGWADNAAGSGYRAQVQWMLDSGKSNRPDGGTP